MEIMLTIIFCCLMIFLGIFAYIRDNAPEELNFDHINEDSFQRYAKFFGTNVPSDDAFINKLNSIYCLIVNEKIMDLDIISKRSNCSLEETVLKIRYLKNKRMLGDYYIDTVNKVLIPCNNDDQKLLEIYKPFVYGSHLQIDDIANVLPNKDYLDIKTMRKKVYDDIKYLYDKDLINGIKLDEIDKKIIYYTIEKRKKNEGYETVHCPNCGALVDVEITSKARCSYCGTIVLGTGVDNDEV